MAPLLADCHIFEFSVLAVQEPWQNPSIPTTRNPSNSAFHLHCPPSAEASVYYFVNKSLNSSSYTTCFPSAMYGNLRLISFIQSMRDVMIHNVYRRQNLSPISMETRPPDGPLLLDAHERFSHVSAAISNNSADHVMLGDFNIHHPNWGRPRARPYRASQLLLTLQEINNLSLLLPCGTLTFRRHSEESTIDLVFSSSALSNTLTDCRLREDLDHGSDHYLIETSYLFSPHVSLHVPKPL